LADLKTSWFSIFRMSTEAWARTAVWWCALFYLPADLVLRRWAFAFPGSVKIDPVAIQR